MDYKHYTLKVLEADEKGHFRAVFATMNVVDKQDDLTIPGAFGQQDVILSQWNHGSWQSGASALPIGVGKIFEEGNDAIIAGEFALEDADAQKTYKMLKYLKEKGRNVEWSYALPEIEFENREQDGKRIRVLKRIKVNEVSPVLMGAGINTRLLYIKSGKTVTPGENETEQEFISRCIGFYVEEGRDQEQAAAICHRIYREGKSSKLFDHVSLVTEDVGALVKRLSKVASLRESQGDHVGEATMQRVLALRAKLTDLVTKVDQIAKEHSAVEQITLQVLETINRYGG